MKPPRLSEEVVPVQELRAQLARFIEQVASTGRPLVVTQRGRAAAVLVSPAMLDELEADRELVRRLLRGLRDVRAGRIEDGDAILRKARKSGRGHTGPGGATGPIAAAGADADPGE